jgi:MoaA/NifB/PqqE/SkfB family radical SAM enzyme
MDFDQNSCRFLATGDVPNVPLSVILQITRKCNFSCVFCSEPEQVDDMPIENIRSVVNNLNGVSRVYLSGGEPLMRRDFAEVLSLFKGRFIVGVPTNGSFVGAEHIAAIKDASAYVTIGIEGPRTITSRVRGNYDSIIRGIKEFERNGVPLSLCSVVMSCNAEFIPYVCQIGDVFQAKKIKLVMPIPKGNALNLSIKEYLSDEAIDSLAERLKSEKDKSGWKSKIVLTRWGADIEGYSLLVYPDGNVYAWPVYGRDDKVLFLGNLVEESIGDIWKRYPYKANHFAKYFGQAKSITVI